uniref:Centrosomal protein 43 n=1 Tax=Lepisosteus oculatus TaxID=7918 RepID=W5NKY2_LEPOC
MSAAEEDTELRDLLIQNLENSGVLNKIKAELRAAVFLALEEQEKIESRTPLVNESLKKFLNTKDGRLVVSLIMDFLQVFNLDFTLAVFQPEINTLNGLENREAVAKELGITEPEGNKVTPLLLEVIRRGRHKEKIGFAEALEVLNYVVHGLENLTYLMGTFTVLKLAQKIPRYKGFVKQREEKAGKKKKMMEASHSDTSLPSLKSKSIVHTSARESKQSENSKGTSLMKKEQDLDVDEEDEGDSFFDDPLPRPQKTYGWRTDSAKPLGSLTSLSDAPPLKTSLGSTDGEAPLKPISENRNGNEKDRGLKDLTRTNDKISSLGLVIGSGYEDEEYDDDFNSTSHQSDKTKSEVSIGEEIEEEVSIEGADFSTTDKLEDLTLDHSISQFSNSADYMEGVE